jgi:VanZ family protein
MNNLKRHRYLIYTVLWMAVIFIFSSENGNLSNMNNTFVVELLRKIGLDIGRAMPLVEVNYIIRKAAHVIEYCILGILLFKTYSSYLYKKPLMLSFVSGFLYACSDEFHQYFVPGRGPSFKDVLIDTSGVLLGVFLICMLSYRIYVKKNIQL